VALAIRKSPTERERRCGLAVALAGRRRIEAWRDFDPHMFEGLVSVLERDRDVELSHQTLDGWVVRLGEELVHLAEALRHELLGGSYLQADETPVGVGCTMRIFEIDPCLAHQFSNSSGA